MKIISKVLKRKLKEFFERLGQGDRGDLFFENSTIYGSLKGLIQAKSIKEAQDGFFNNCF